MVLVDAAALDGVSGKCRAVAGRLDLLSVTTAPVLASIGRRGTAGHVTASLQQAGERLENLGANLATRAAIARVIERMFSGGGRWPLSPQTAGPSRHPALELPDSFNPSVTRLHLLFTLLGLQTPEAATILEELGGDEAQPPAYAIDEWLWTAHPDLAGRRHDIATELASLIERRDQLEADRHDGSTTAGTYDWLADARIAEELHGIEQRIDALSVDWLAREADVEQLLEPLPTEDRDSLLGLMLLASTLIGEMPLSFQPYVDVELRRLRTEYAVRASVGGGEDDPIRAYIDRVTYGPAADLPADDRVRELASIIDTLDPPGQPGLVASFLEGLTLGDLLDTDLRGGSAIAHIAGQVVSGELVFGDVRDLAAALAEGEWGDALLAGVGFIPLAGALRHGDEGAEALRRVEKAAGIIQDVKLARRIVRAFDITSGARRLADDVLESIGRHGFTTDTQDHGAAALATVMTREDLTATLVELRRLDGERRRIVDAIDRAIDIGSVPAEVESRLRAARNAITDNLGADDVLGAIRDSHGVPVYAVVDDVGSLRRVHHDEEVLNALVAVENALSLDRWPGPDATAVITHDLEPLYLDLHRLVGVNP